MENFETNVNFTKRLEIAYLEWKDISKKSQLEERHKGCRVWVAGENLNQFKSLKRVHYKGDPEWIDGDGYTLEDQDGFMSYYFKQSCRLHPYELKIDNVEIPNEGDFYDRIAEERLKRETNKNNK